MGLTREEMVERGNRLTAALKEKGLHYVKAADLIGCGYSTIANLMAGRQGASDDLWARICGTLDIRWQWIDKGDPPIFVEHIAAEKKQTEEKTEPETPKAVSQETRNAGTKTVMDEPETKVVLVKPLPLPIQNNTIMLNFLEYPDIFEAVITNAHKNMRTPEMQILWILKTLVETPSKILVQAREC